MPDFFPWIPSVLYRHPVEQKTEQSVLQHTASEYVMQMLDTGCFSVCADTSSIKKMHSTKCSGCMVSSSVSALDQQ